LEEEERNSNNITIRQLLALADVVNMSYSRPAALPYGWFIKLSIIQTVNTLESVNKIL